MRITAGPLANGGMGVELEGVGPMTIQETEQLIVRLRWALLDIQRRSFPGADCSCKEWESSEEPGYQRLVHGPTCELTAIVEAPSAPRAWSDLYDRGAR